MYTTPLRAALERAADPHSGSLADITHFLGALRHELLSLEGVVNATDDHKKPLIIWNNKDIFHTLVQEVDYIHHQDRLLGLRVLTDLRLTPDNQLTGINIGLHITPPHPASDDGALLKVSIRPGCYKYDSGAGQYLIRAIEIPGAEWKKSRTYSWDQKDVSVHIFATWLASFGSPALSSQLRPPESIVPNPLRTALLPHPL